MTRMCSRAVPYPSPPHRVFRLICTTAPRPLASLLRTLRCCLDFLSSPSPPPLYAAPRRATLRSQGETHYRAASFSTQPPSPASPPHCKSAHCKPGYTHRLGMLSSGGASSFTPSMIRSSRARRCVDGRLFLPLPAALHAFRSFVRHRHLSTIDPPAPTLCRRCPLAYVHVSRMQLM